MNRLLAHTSAHLEREYKQKKERVQTRLAFLRAQKSSFWSAEQERKTLALFKTCAAQVPAYRDFLKKERVKPEEVRTAADFKLLPPMSKDGYLRAYPWEKLCFDGSQSAQSLVLTSTSGSTGQPFYFPRNGVLDENAAVYHQLFVENAGLNPHKSTLALVCFGMGVWIGGVITYQALKSVSERGFPMTLLTPGVNKKEIFEALKNVAPHYDQLILCGYPPFMKDVIDEAPLHGIRWKDFDVRMIFAAEGFSEKFRDYVLRKTGMQNPYRDTMNIYGSADLGTMATETPLSILVRRLALKHKNLYKKLFADATRLPTLAQYVPQFVSFESAGRTMLLTGDNVLPLVRYEIGDQGGTMTYTEVEAAFASEGLDLKREARRAGIDDTIAELPFVYIYERSDFSTKLYGAIIYPEYVKAGLQTPALEKYVTGKFTMNTLHDAKQDEYLEVNVELKPGITESDWLAREVSESISNSLIERSAEHANNWNLMGERVRPRITFWPHEHPTHFQTGIKQKWVKKTLAA